jgi:hypothetical protein
MVVNLILIALPNILISLVILYTPSVLWLLLPYFYWNPRWNSWREMRPPSSIMARKVRHWLRHGSLSSMKQSCWEDMRAHGWNWSGTLLIGMPVELLLVTNHPFRNFPAHLLIDPIGNSMKIFVRYPMFIAFSDCSEGLCSLWTCSTFATQRDFSRLLRIHSWKVSRDSLIPWIRSSCNSMIFILYLFVVSTTFRTCLHLRFKLKTDFAWSRSIFILERNLLFNSKAWQLNTLSGHLILKSSLLVSFGLRLFSLIKKLLVPDDGPSHVSPLLIHLWVYILEVIRLRL